MIRNTEGHKSVLQRKGSDNMEHNSSMYMYAEDVAEILGTSRNYAYKVIRELNEELGRKGYRVVAGRIPNKFFKEKFYGFDEEQQK